MERRYRKDLWQKVISRDADGCPDQKRRCQIGHPAPDILTGVARRHGPGSVFRFAGWAPTGPGPARAVLGWPAGACWRSQQPKHGLHTPPELWNAFGACGGLLGAKCHSRLPTSSNSLCLPQCNRPTRTNTSHFLCFPFVYHPLACLLLHPPTQGQ